MNITIFNHGHIDQAREIARLNYEEERLAVPALPDITAMPDLEHFADNQLGVAAMEGEKLLGFLCAYYPRDNCFTTNVSGTFSPIHAHGVLPTCDIAAMTGKPNLNRDRMYSLLYQEAAKIWVGTGIRIHAIALYTHDKEAINSFFYNSFGLRCIDAIRSLGNRLEPAELDRNIASQVEYCEVPKEEWGYLLKEHNGLIRHLGESPCFMKYDLMDEDELYRRAPEEVRYFAAKTADGYVAYIKISDGGENFATEVKDMRNICGAYCQPAYRGTGVYHNLLVYLMNTLSAEGFLRLGVDCESFNPTARGFWLKHFTEYTHSLVRRIDDKAFTE